MILLPGCKSLAQEIADNLNAPGDCIAIDASNIHLERDRRDHIVTDGQSQILRAASADAARDMAALAGQHEYHCFIGRDNTRSNRDDYVFEYWVGESDIAVDPPPESDCLSYDPADLRIVDEGADGYLLTDGRSRMALLDTESDAERALNWAQRHTRHCFIGRDNDRRNRSDYIAEFWAGEGMNASERQAAREAADTKERTATGEKETTSEGADEETPSQIRINFNETTITYEPGRGGPQVLAGNHVLSYGDDWDVRELKPYLYHVRYTHWNDVYWKVNTSRETVYRVEGGTFGSLGGTSQTVNFDVSVRGRGNDPSRFTVTIPNARWLYAPATSSSGAAGPQMLVDDDVLSYRQGWEVVKMKPYLYHARRPSWDNFYWQINTSREQIYVVRDGTFGQYGGSSRPMSAEVIVRR